MMKEVTFSLPGWQLDWIKTRAAARKASFSDVVRDLILRAKLDEDGPSKASKPAQ
jgi:hypothetical protein